jgi:hypothetical protein
MAWNHKSRITAMAVAIQSTAGVFTAPSAADLIAVSSPQISEEIISTEDPTATGAVHTPARIYLGKTSQIQASLPLRGPGGTSPFAANAWVPGRILQAAGYAEVINPSAIGPEAGGTGMASSALVLGASASSVDNFYVGFPVQVAEAGAGAIKGTSVIDEYVGSTKAASLAETLEGGAPADASQITIPACVVYQLGTLSTDPPLLSVSVWKDKKRYDYYDVRVGQLTFDRPVSNEQNQVFPSIDFQLSGLLQAVADDTTPSLPSSLLGSLPPYKNGKFSLDRVKLGHQSTRFQMGGDVAGASNSHQEEGQDQYEILSTNRTMDIDLNQMNVTDFDIESRVKGQFPMSVMSLWGQGQGNRFAFLEREILLNPLNNPGDRNGFVNLTGNAAFQGVDKSSTLAIWW